MILARHRSDGNSPMLLVLVLVALVPAACVLWFMNAAMRNERLAVQQELTGVYVNRLASIERQLTSHWRDRLAAIKSASSDSSAVTFAALVRSNLADSAVLYDPSGKVLYPASAVLESGAPLREGADWMAARELEYRKMDPVAAAEAYSRIAASSSDVHVKARATQSQATCIFKSGARIEAIRLLTALSTDAALENAVGPQGTLIVPNAQLLLLKWIKRPADALFRETLASLSRRVNDYADPLMTASQRLFLMQELRGLSGVGAAFPTLEAEQLAAEYIDRSGSLPSGPLLEPAAIEGVYRSWAPDHHLILLFREDRLVAELTSLSNETALPELEVRLVPPHEAAPRSHPGSRPRLPVPLQAAGEFMPGWNLALAFKGIDPLEAASARQTRMYLWTGTFVIAITGMLAFIAARFVGAQMRLTRLRNDLVSTVSHELKTPLASMRALVDTLLAGRYSSPEQLRQYLKLVAKENQRLSHLIENFLSFSRMDRNKQRFQMTDVNVATVVKDALEAVHERFDSPHCDVAVEVGPDLPTVFGDREALTGVLINLLDNAWKYTGEIKRISVRACRDNGAIHLEVSDNGIGLSRAEAERIFDPFYQVDQSLSRKSSGCGLGLSIVRFILREHNGSIQVRAEPGRGCTFTVRLPCSQPAHAR